MEEKIQKQNKLQIFAVFLNIWIKKGIKTKRKKIVLIIFFKKI